MNDIIELMTQPGAMLICAAIVTILMMLAAIMLRISRRDGERDRRMAELKQALDEQISGVRAHTETRLRESDDSLLKSIEQLNDGVARALSDSERGQSSRMDEYAERVSRAADAESKRSHAFNSDVLKRMDELSARVEQEHADSVRRISALREDVARDTAREVNARLDAALGGLQQQLERLTGELTRLSGTTDELLSLREALDARPRETMTGVQLDALLMQWLSPGRYVRRFEVGTGSGRFADFAILLPDESGQMLYLPVDASFPTDEYSGSWDAKARRHLADDVKEYARRMADELIKPGLTTDFALMFIPSELVSARVNELADVMSGVQQSQRVIPVGPASFLTMVRALEGGMNALAMSRRSAEVERLLEDVRKELGRFSRIAGGSVGDARPDEAIGAEDALSTVSADTITSAPADGAVAQTAPEADRLPDNTDFGAYRAPYDTTVGRAKGAAVRSVQGDSELDIWG